MFYGYSLIDLTLYLLLNTLNVNAFICPQDGRWPHPADCEKFYTCQAGTGTEAWCGNGMTYDVDHARCDLSKNIDCKDGERPNWTAPSGWPSASVTTNIIIRTTASLPNHNKELTKQHLTSVRPTTVILSKRLQSRLLLPINVLAENNPCTFQGSMPDQDNCQSYFMCKEETIVRLQCPDKHLFDEDLRSCNDYRKVFCSNRPTKDQENDPCTGQPNGWYADHANQCRSYYFCTEQRQTKMGECPDGSKWNSQRLNCGDPRYIAAPCGYRSNNAITLLGPCHCFTIILTLTLLVFNIPADCVCLFSYLS